MLILRTLSKSSTTAPLSSRYSAASTNPFSEQMYRGVDPFWITAEDPLMLVATPCTRWNPHGVFLLPETCSVHWFATLVTFLHTNLSCGKIKKAGLHPLLRTIDKKMHNMIKGIDENELHMQKSKTQWCVFHKYIGKWNEQKWFHHLPSWWILLQQCSWGDQGIVLYFSLLFVQHSNWKLYSLICPVHLSSNLTQSGLTMP